MTKLHRMIRIGLTVANAARLNIASSIQCLKLVDQFQADTRNGRMYVCLDCRSKTSREKDHFGIWVCGCCYSSRIQNVTVRMTKYLNRPQPIKPDYVIEDRDPRKR